MSMFLNKALKALCLTSLLILLAACGTTAAGPAASTGSVTASGAAASAEDNATASPQAGDEGMASPMASQSAAAEAAAALASGATGQKLNVVATYSILGDLVRNVGGDLVKLRTLVGPGGDPHVYEPTPQDSTALAEAGLVFENGLDFETWIDELYDASGSQAERVVVTEQIELLPAPEGNQYAESDEHADASAEGGEHGHGEYDPHVWNDPNNAMLMVEAIRDALVAADAANAVTYQANAQAYLAELQALDQFAKTETESLPAERRKLVTTHDTFGYFADRYGYEVVGTALGSVSTEAADPSAGEIAELVEQIKAAGVAAIFAENSNNPALMEQIAAEAGVQLVPTLYPESLSEPDGPAGTYLDMVRHNVGTIVEALGQQ